MHILLELAHDDILTKLNPPSPLTPLPISISIPIFLHYYLSLSLVPLSAVPMTPLLQLPFSKSFYP